MEQDLAPARPLCSTTGLTFLSLPHHVRESIYAYLSLSPDLIDLNYTNLKVYPKGAYPETLRCRRLGPYEPYILKKVETATTEEAWELGSETEEGEEETYGEPCLGRAWGVQQSMLLVSKQVHGEVEAWIYANSVIRVCPGQPLGLSRFMSMSENAIAHMGALTIRLDKSTDAVYQNKWDNCPELPQRIDLSCAWGREVLCKWREVIEKLCRSVKPGQLRLRVVLAAKTMANAETLLDPMMALPLLKDCGICLNMDGPPTWWKIHTVRQRTHLVRVLDY